MRCLLALVLVAAASGATTEFVQAVEFPYYNYPRTLWERELVWLKNIGVHTVAFSVGQNPPKTDPRADLPAFLRIVRRLGLRAWIYDVPADLAPSLAMQLESHGGPIAFVEGPSTLEAPQPPAPVTRVSATTAGALSRSRDLFAAGHGSLLWKDVEDTLSPGLHRGVVSFAGDERPASATLRRDAALLRFWAAILPSLQTERQLPGKFSAKQYFASNLKGDSAVEISNPTAAAITAPLHVYDPGLAHEIIIQKVTVPAGETLWLPVNISLAHGGLCEDCAGFAPGDRILYATAELQSIEFENGILACEFNAPAAGEVVIQLSKTPQGPLIAGGHPADFEWDEKNSVVRLQIPQGKGAAARVRIGLAIEPPDSSAFFGESSRLILGKPNVVSTSYSSDALANRSRLLAPPSFHLKAIPKTPLEIDYELTPDPAAPHESTHGEFVTLALEADGVRLGRARLQLFRPASVRIREAIPLLLGPDAQLAPDPPLISFDPKGGREIHIALRNNYPAIENYVVELSGKGLTFLPARSEVSVAAATEREIAVRVFSDDPANAAAAAPRPALIRVSGAADIEQPFQVLPIGRGETVVYARDVDGDGVEDSVIENQHVRASFSGVDGRWMEWVWKDTNSNWLPDAGLVLGEGQATSRLSPSALEFRWKNSRRTVKLGQDDRLSIEQDAPLPAESLQPGTKDGVKATIDRSTPNRVIYLLQRAG